MKKEEINYIKDLVQKPWGHYRNVAQNEGKWNLKVIIIKKDKRLSLQRHQLRGELWVVADGKIEAHIGNEVRILKVKDSIYIKKGQTHRATALEDATIIELTFGEHDENDIERIEDDYGRTN